mmetsp:Transcript_69800/g.195122  ORF Transcript_69800/g.195122 Transcript_69800/m.195122 type:complete len:155 (-) Transcript_69800:218-682(-)
MRWDVEAVDAASGVSEQPHGTAETLQGARNRCSDAAARSSPDARYVVAMENGIDEFVPGQWLDFAWVVVDDKQTGKTAKTMSTMVEFPNAACEASVHQHERRVTAGSLLAADDAAVDGKDPHGSLTSGLVSRAEILTQAILVCLGELRAGNGGP